MILRFVAATLAAGLASGVASAAAPAPPTVSPGGDAASEEACEDVPTILYDVCSREGDAHAAVLAAAWHAFGKGYLRPLAKRLAASGDPRKLAIAANLWSVTTDDPADRNIDRWRAQAFDAGADDPIVAVLLQNDLRSVDGIARQARERWRASEPANLAPAMLSGEPVEDLLASAGTFDRFSLHLPDLLSTIDSTLATVPPDEAQGALLRETGLDLPSLSASYTLLWGVMAAPSFSPLVAACKGDTRHATPTRNGNCRRLGRTLLAHSDTVVGELFGAALLRHDDDAALRAEGEAWRRNWAWQSARLRELGEHATGDCTPAKMRATPGLGEGDAMRACLRDAGIALEPPADWSPEAAPASGQ